MRTTWTRWSVLALLLIALLPADLALARWVARNGWPRAAARAGAGVARGTARMTLDTATRWLGHGADMVGTTLVDAACWMADRASGPPCRGARPAPRIVPLGARTRVIVVAEDGAGAIPVPAAGITRSSTPSDS
ncbi:MAG TPA: hypothetical protein VLV15_05720 [Dongiaceae bacterium]|nr:hypothetical protein [Dongiaceae bacterium]